MAARTLDVGVHSSREGRFADTLGRVKIVGTNSASLARAYGVAAATPNVRLAPASIETRAAAISDSASIASIRPADAITQAGLASGTQSVSGIERLVAASVPGRVDFDSSTTSLSAPGNYTMYGRPADRNAAAVAVQTGRALDIQA